MDYDHEGNHPLIIEASFARYSASIDVPEGTLRVNDPVNNYPRVSITTGKPLCNAKRLLNHAQ